MSIDSVLGKQWGRVSRYITTYSPYHPLVCESYIIPSQHSDCVSVCANFIIHPEDNKLDEQYKLGPHHSSTWTRRNFNEAEDGHAQSSALLTSLQPMLRVVDKGLLWCDHSTKPKEEVTAIMVGFLQSCHRYFLRLYHAIQRGVFFPGWPR